MKNLFLSLAFIALSGASFAEEPSVERTQSVPISTYQAVVVALKRQREAAADGEAQAAVQIAELTQQLMDAKAALDAARKQLADAAEKSVPSK